MPTALGLLLGFNSGAGFGQESATGWPVASDNTKEPEHLALAPGSRSRVRTSPTINARRMPLHCVCTRAGNCGATVSTFGLLMAWPSFPVKSRTRFSGSKCCESFWPAMACNGHPTPWRSAAVGLSSRPKFRTWRQGDAGSGGAAGTHVAHADDARHGSRHVDIRESAAAHAALCLAGLAPYNNYSRVAYPTTYPYEAFPFIGPMYPFPKIPLGWRSVSLTWEDGCWWYGRKATGHDWWRIRYN